MTRLPRNNSACRLLDHFLGAASALLLGLAFSAQSTLAEELTPARIKAATSAVDSAMIEANTALSLVEQVHGTHRSCRRGWVPRWHVVRWHRHVGMSRTAVRC